MTGVRSQGLFGGLENGPQTNSQAPTMATRDGGMTVNMSGNRSAAFAFTGKKASSSRAGGTIPSLKKILDQGLNTASQPFAAIDQTL